MGLRGKYIRSLSLFVVVFLCLNPASVFCLAYCNYHIQVSSAHCPLKKQNPDCHESKKSAPPQNSTVFDTKSSKACVIPVNIIAAPVESKFGVVIDVARVADLEKVVLAPIALVRSRQIPKFYYRPPPNDGRYERIRNQVFRI